MDQASKQQLLQQINKLEAGVEKLQDAMDNAKPDDPRQEEWQKLQIALAQRLAALEQRLAVLEQKEVLILQQQQQQANVSTYTCGGLSPADFRFDAPLPTPVLILREDASRCSLISIPGALSGVAKIVSGDYHDLSRYFLNYACNEKSGSAEDGYHGRNDALLKVICCVGSMKSERNRVNTSSVAGTRVDCVLASDGYPPMVVVEEKASAAEMLEADNDVRKKFVFLPHYDQLSYVIGISIAGDEVKMYRHWREPPPSPSSDCVVFNLQDQGDCLRALRAAVNVGRLCKHIKDNLLLHRVTIPFNKQSDRPNSYVTVCHTHVVKEYKRLSQEQEEFLLAFYAQTKGVPYLEQLQKVEKGGPGTRTRFHLVPVGLERLPGTVHALLVSLRCILEVLVALHKLRLIFMDLRWNNTVEVRKLRYVIDAEFVRCDGQPYPALLLHRCPWVSTCCPLVDLWALGLMLEQAINNLPATSAIPKELEQLRGELCSQEMCRKLTAAAILERFELIRIASPSKPPAASVDANMLPPDEAQQQEASAAAGAHIASGSTVRDLGDSLARLSIPLQAVDPASPQQGGARESARSLSTSGQNRRRTRSQSRNHDQSPETGGQHEKRTRSASRRLSQCIAAASGSAVRPGQQASSR